MIFLYRYVLILISALLVTSICNGKVIEIVATPGGNYTLPKKLEDTHIYIRGSGSKEKKFKLLGAGTDGSMMTGNSFIKAIASNVIIENIHFQNNDIRFIDSEALLQIGQKDITSDNIEVRNLKFTHDVNLVDLGKKTQFQWIKVYASNVLIERCLFEGKKNRLPVIHVEANYPGVIIADNIFRNILPRKEEALEAISIGYMSGTSDCLILRNIFDNCKGDSETISCKANGIRIHENTFRNSRSGVSIRWGDNIEVVKNNFSQVPTQIRITGRGHIIKFNTFEHQVNGHIVLMKGDKSYREVSNIFIDDNTFIDEPRIAVLETSKSNNWPSDIYFRNNVYRGKIIPSKKLPISFFRYQYLESKKTGKNLKSYFYNLIR